MALQPAPGSGDGQAEGLRDVRREVLEV